MGIRSPQTFLLQCYFTQPIVPATLGAQGRSLLEGQTPWRGKGRAAIRKSFRALTPFTTVNTQDGKHSFLQACWLQLNSGLPATHRQPRLLWRPLLCSQQKCFLFQQQETKTCLGETRESQPRPLVKLTD